MLSLEWQANCSLCYMFGFSEWTIFHFQCWSLLIEAIDPKTSCVDWLLGGNAGIMGICVCVCVYRRRQKRVLVWWSHTGNQCRIERRKMLCPGVAAHGPTQKHTYTLNNETNCDALWAKKKTKGLILEKWAGDMSSSSAMLRRGKAECRGFQIRPLRSSFIPPVLLVLVAY